VKLLFSEDGCEYLQRHKEELQAIEEKNKVKIKFQEAKKIKVHCFYMQHQKRDELVLTFEGKLKPIQMGV
jgi:hypothetical protein